MRLLIAPLLVMFTLQAGSYRAEVEAFRDEVVAGLPGGIDPGAITVDLVGASVGPHLGPGAVGAVVLYARD